MKSIKNKKRLEDDKLNKEDIDDIEDYLIIEILKKKILMICK